MPQEPALESGEDAYVPLAVEPFHVRAWRLVRALLVGGAATGTDLAILTLCIRVLHIRPEYARVPALFAGAVMQFLGNRWFTFRAQRGSLGRHTKLFFAFELVAYAANLLLFKYLVHWIHILPPELVSQIGTFLIFVGYSYPVRRLVIFRLLRTETRPSNPR